MTAPELVGVVAALFEVRDDAFNWRLPEAEPGTAVE